MTSRFGDQPVYRMHATKPGGKLITGYADGLDEAKAWAVGKRMEQATRVTGELMRNGIAVQTVTFYPLNPLWTVYGRRLARKTAHPWRKDDYAPLHKEGFTSEADATLFLMDTVMEHGASQIDAVVVRLDNGLDRNGERHVVRRVGEGKAWWE